MRLRLQKLKVSNVLSFRRFALDYETEVFVVGSVRGGIRGDLLEVHRRMVYDF